MAASFTAASKAGSTGATSSLVALRRPLIVTESRDVSNKEGGRGGIENQRGREKTRSTERERERRNT